MRSRNHGSDGSVLLEFAVELGTVQVSMEMSATLSRLELNAEFPAECRFRQMDAYVRLIFAKTPPYIRALRLSLEGDDHTPRFLLVQCGMKRPNKLIRLRFLSFSQNSRT